MQVVASGLGSQICSPVFDLKDTLHIVSTGTGEIFRIFDKKSQSFAVGGAPSCVRFNNEGEMYLGDFNHHAILLQQEEEITPLIRDYEGRSFKGPHSCCFDRLGSLYFTDSGPVGETGLRDPRGSVFCVSPDGQLLQPLMLDTLACPTGIALSPDDSTLYVCELMQNRILRAVQRPTGVFHFSVFHQFSGGMGPMAVAVQPTTGNLYVANYDFAGTHSSAVGYVTVLTPQGEQLERIQMGAPEVTGLAFSREQPNMLYITEASTNTVYRWECH
ncbi:putative Lactonase drp35 [Paratrimastix pyriformis]|uniref:Lactonase drp35 n=1 Tax=Paratrimastix pyriformis TaxID=342808 RepID=A0ABQ8UNK1_9EUKA|nr:putative Lactonase drp35 [Paratrimastix pyriformis]|eukprot:GAFH01002911.1.p1 GENE.GAFH01002911.1~~GAFH01002911.1.p1  ORF type:complete len:280 (-),score=49.12 GAFH01002911.1:207-1025(-)